MTGTRTTGVRLTQRAGNQCADDCAQVTVIQLKSIYSTEVQLICVQLICAEVTSAQGTNTLVPRGYLISINLVRL